MEESCWEGAMGQTGAQQWTRTDRIALFTAVLALVFGLVGGVPYISQAIAAYNSLRAHITDPSQGEEVRGDKVLPSGTVDNYEPGEEFLWLVLRTVDEGKWHPSQRLDVQPGGTWKAAYALRLPDLGKYELYVFRAPGTADGSFQSYMDEANKTKRYPGLISLPEGVSRLDWVSFVRVG